MMKHLAILTLVVAAAAVSAVADPLANESLKFDQQPMINTVINGVSYFGHDEISTATLVSSTSLLYSGTSWMADDFADYSNSPITHVQWWGSYVQGAPGTVGSFLVEFLSDSPADPAGGYSRPDQLLSADIVNLGPLTPGSGTFTEAPVAGSSAAEPVFVYNAELKVPFPETAKTVYWLKIVALTQNPDTLWGWHTRDYTLTDPLAAVPPDVVPGEYQAGTIPVPGTPGVPIWHFQDDAVQGSLIQVTFDSSGNPIPYEDVTAAAPQNYVDLVDGPGPDGLGIFNGIGTYSEDLAFSLYYTVPEPCSVVLLILGGVALAFRRKRA